MRELNYHTKCLYISENACHACIAPLIWISLKAIALFSFAVIMLED